MTENGLKHSELSSLFFNEYSLKHCRFTFLWQNTVSSIPTIASWRDW